METFAKKISRKVSSSISFRSAPQWRFRLYLEKKIKNKERAERRRKRRNRRRKRRKGIVGDDRNRFPPWFVFLKLSVVVVVVVAVWLWYNTPVSSYIGAECQSLWDRPGLLFSVRPSPLPDPPTLTV